MIWGFIHSMAMDHQVTTFVLQSSSFRGVKSAALNNSKLRARLVGWSAPAEGWLKFNVDGDVTIDFQASSGGFPIFAIIWGFGLQYVFLMDLTTVLDALEMVISLETPRVIIKSDSPDVIRLITFSNLSFRPVYGDLAQAICHLKEACGAMRFEHVHRDADHLVDYVA